MYFIDVQGTLISDEDKTPLSGAVETLAYLRHKNIPYVVVTNNTKKSSTVFLDFLVQSGFDVDAQSYIDPLMLLLETVPQKNIAPYGDAQFIQTLQSMGYTVDFNDPKAVLIGVKKDYTGEIFAQMIDFLLRGAMLVGMHETTLYASGGKRYPGSGAVLKLLQAATQVPYNVVGKPSTLFYEAAKKLIAAQVGRAVNFSEITMISDDLKGDLVGAKALGMKTVFVLSGKYRTTDEIVPLLSPHEHPDKICKDMAEVLEQIKGATI